MLIVTKILLFILVLASLECIREIINFVLAFKRAEKFELPRYRKILLMTAISYIMTICITGFKVL